MSLKKCSIVWILLVWTTWVTAAEIVSVTLPESTTVNAPFTCEIKIRKAPSERITPDQTKGWIEALSIDSVELVSTDSSATVRFHLLTYSPPTCSLPSFGFTVSSESGDGRSTTLKTGPRVVAVRSILTKPVDSVVAADFGDPLAAGRFPWKKLLRFAVLVFAAAAVLLGVIALIRKEIMRRKNKNFWGRELEPQLPPYDEAMSALASVERDKLLEIGQLRETVFLLSEIVKRYIGRTFHCAVQESTSSEFRRWIAGADIPREQKVVLERFIAISDPVKFANVLPGLTETQSLYEDVKRLIITVEQLEKEKRVQQESSKK